MDLRKTRWLTGPLALFDLGLGLVAAALPGLYVELMHGAPMAGGEFLLRRTGVLWLFFALCEAWAFLAPSSAAALFLVGMLRLMDVPADVVYLLSADRLTPFGRLGLAGAPCFNLLAGALLVRAASRSPRLTKAPAGS